MHGTRAAWSLFLGWTLSASAFADPLDGGHTLVCDLPASVKADGPGQFLLPGGEPEPVAIASGRFEVRVPGASGEGWVIHKSGRSYKVTWMSRADEVRCEDFDEAGRAMWLSGQVVLDAQDPRELELQLCGATAPVSAASPTFDLWVPAASELCRPSLMDTQTGERTRLAGLPRGLKGERAKGIELRSTANAVMTGAQLDLAPLPAGEVLQERADRVLTLWSEREAIFGNLTAIVARRAEDQKLDARGAYRHLKLSKLVAMTQEVLEMDAVRPGDLSRKQVRILESYLIRVDRKDAVTQLQTLRRTMKAQPEKVSIGRRNGSVRAWVGG